MPKEEGISLLVCHFQLGLAVEYISVSLDIDFDGDIGDTLVQKDDGPIRLDKASGIGAEKTKVTSVKVLPKHKEETLKRRLEEVAADELVVCSRNSDGTVLSMDVIQDPRIIR